MPFRTIDTDIWSNAWFYDLTPAQKIVYVYLFSNPLVSNIGIMEISRKQLAATTGAPLSAANKFLEELEQEGQIVTDGRFILVVKFIAKQTHFGNNSEASKNDKLLKNLKTLFAACPSEKLQRVLQDTYPALFCENAAPCSKETNPLQQQEKPLSSTQEAPCDSETSPLSPSNKPLVSDSEGSGGEYGDIGEFGDYSNHSPLPPHASQPAATASGECVFEQERSLPEQPAYLDAIPLPEDEQPAACGPVPVEQAVSGESAAAPEAVLKPEQPAKEKKKRTRKSKKPADRRDELPLQPEKWERFLAIFPRQEAEQDGIIAWNDAYNAGVLPEIEFLEETLRWQIKHNNWGPHNRYTPMLATYINSRRWRDKKPAMPAGQPVQPRPAYGPQPLAAGYNGYPYPQQFSKADESTYVVVKNDLAGAQVLAEMEAEDRAREQQHAANQD